MYSFRKAVVAVAIAGLILPAAASAQVSTSSVQSLLEQLKSLQTQMQSLNTQQKTVAQQQRQTIGQLMTTLNQGSKGENVKLLQQLLAQDPSIYPEGLISGTYGPKTAAAVKRFQKKHGIEQAGNVGPKTLKKLNELFSKWGNASTSGVRHDDDDKPCFAQGRSTAPGWLKNFGEDGRGKEFKGREREDDDRPCVGTTTPPTADTVAPILSGIVANSITTTGATIVWTTNENASTQIQYGTTTSYGSTSTLNPSLVTAHSVVLTGLANATTYHFRVISKDAAGNTAISGDMTFVTGTPDTTAPVISAVSSTAVATTSASINWTTNENSTSKVYYGTANPLVLGSALTVNNASLVTAHTLGLSGLSASTTYYYVVESADSSSNTSVSTQVSFTTTN